MRLILSIIIFSIVTKLNAFQWNGNWAMDCDFIGNDLHSVKIAGEKCFQTCINYSGCTHFTWTRTNGGTCYLKTGKTCKNNAQWNQGAVCGVVVDEPCGGSGDNIDTGNVLEKGDLLWSDEFDYQGSPSSENWIQQEGGHGWGNNEAQFYTKDRNSVVSNGNLVITSKKENFGGKGYTSGRLTSVKKFKYGIFEMRAKLPKGRGIWSAFWMLAAKRPLNWPTDGEIDIMENVGYDETAVHATIHTEKYNHMIGTQIGKVYRLSNPHTEFHTYTLDWTPTYIKAYVDGINFYTYNKRDTSFAAWPFDTDFNILLNVAVGGNWGGALGIDNNIFPTTYTIEYVRQYQNGFVQV